MAAIKAVPLWPPSSGPTPTSARGSGPLPSRVAPIVSVRVPGVQTALLPPLSSLLSIPAHGLAERRGTVCKLVFRGTNSVDITANISNYGERRCMMPMNVDVICEARHRNLVIKAGPGHGLRSWRDLSSPWRHQRANVQRRVPKQVRGPPAPPADSMHASPVPSRTRSASDLTFLHSPDRA